jgi:hypothetical protein
MRHVAFAWLSAGVVAVAGSVAVAAVPPYSLVGSYELPANTSAYDVLPDGRAVAVAGSDIYVQDAANVSGFTRVGAVAPGLISSFGASFLRISPGGSTIAVGDNVFGPGASVLTFALADLDPAAATMPAVWASDNTDAHWLDGDTLLVSGSGSAGAVVREIDLGSATSRVVIGNIGGASGGITADGAYVYTANGFDFSPGGSSTGEVRAFSLAEIAALTPGAALDFEGAGVAVADALSGTSLGFDPLGNMLIGGGDAFGAPPDAGYAAVVDGVSIAAALLGGPIAPDSAELRLTPRLASDSYFTRFNIATGELLVTYYDNGTFSGGLTVYRYAVPTPGMVVFAGTWLAFAARRRRA